MTSHDPTLGSYGSPRWEHLTLSADRLGLSRRVLLFPIMITLEESGQDHTGFSIGSETLGPAVPGIKVPPDVLVPQVDKDGLQILARSSHKIPAFPSYGNNLYRGWSLFKNKLR